MRVLFVIKQIDYEPLGIMCLSSVLKEGGHEVALAIASQEDPVRVAKEFSPGIVGYSVTTGLQGYYLDLNRRIKEEMDVFSVFGGPHPTFFPEMIEERGVDGICIGEGEGAMLDLANAMDEGKAIAGIANWHFKLDGQIICNPVRPLVTDLDTLPLPDRDLVYSKHKVTRQSKIKHFISSRGCPYNCTYCFNQAFSEIYRRKGRRVRQLSVDNVLKELASVKENYPLEFVVFVDDMFVWFSDWVEEFARQYPHTIGLPFFCNVRANLVTEEKARQLKEAGCVSVGMGLEAGNDHLRNDLLKRRMSRQQIMTACRILREVGLNLITTNMVGLPTASLENDFETLELNIACRPSYANVFIFQPYPRTELGQFALQNSLMEGNFDDISASAWDNSVLKFKDEQEKREIENLQKLFAIAVEWPFLEPLVRLLIKLPKNRLFWLIYKLWKGYAIKSRIHPIRLSPREYINIVQHFMKLD